ncbi:MAG TPA: hypothetical protein VMN57_01445 [Anaerolineales bacterium]|nr:hypothetical protein [Anaerolineales bacterium]
MTAAVDLLAGFLREAWTAIAGALLMLGLLALLAQVLRGAGSSLIGSRYGVASAAGSAVGIVFVLLFAFLGLPALVEAGLGTAVGGGMCGPLVGLGAAAGGLIAALAALRMLMGAARALSGALVSSESGAQALLEAGEALIGMLAAGMAGPVAGHFLGAC